MLGYIRDTKKKAFTLAEVMGAVLVLSIIFLLCIPFILQTQEKIKTEMLLKKSYNTLSRAMQMSFLDNGNLGNWGFAGTEADRNIIKTNILPYISVAENCLYGNTNCAPKENYKTLKNRSTDKNFSASPSFIINGGMLYTFEFTGPCRKDGSQCAIVYVDINGKKEPNKFGRDLFAFTLINSTGLSIMPYNHQLSADMLINDPQKGCNRASEYAMNCASLIMDNGWKIEKNYPW